MSRAAGPLPRKVFTDRGVKSSGVGEHWDALVPGLGLRVYPTGRKSWIILYRRNRRKIGSYPATELSAARDRARTMLGDAEAGEDPFATSDSHTVESAASLYLEQHVADLSEDWRGDIRRTLNRDVLPWIGGRPLEDVKRAEVASRLDTVKRRGPHAVKHVRVVLSGLYTWCMDRGLCEANPASRLRIKSPASRDRVLTQSEIRGVWETFLEHGSTTSRAALLSLVGARRLRECRLLRWEWREGSWWTIPAPFIKNRNHSLRFYLPALSRYILPETRESGYVFADVNGDPPTKWQVSHLASRLRGQADWRAQDFRRTAATIMAQCGVSRFVVKQVLGHADSSVTSIYDRHGYDDEKREAVVMLASDLRRIIRSSPTSTRRSRAPSTRRLR